MNRQAETMLTLFTLWMVSMFIFVLFLILRGTFSWDAVIIGLIATGAPTSVLAIGFAVTGAPGRPANVAEAAALALTSALLIVAAASLVFAFTPEMGADPITQGATALTSWQLPFLIGVMLFLILFFTRRPDNASEVD